MEDGAFIGFRAVSFNQGGRAMEPGMGNALLDSYLARIGLSDRVIMYITQASLRHGLTW